MNKELSGEHLLFTEQHKNIVLLYVNIFLFPALLICLVWRQSLRLREVLP